MNLVTNVGKTLVNVGTKAVKVAVKNPKTTLISIGTYAVANKIVEAKKDIKEKASTLSLLAKIGVAVGAAIVLKKAGTKIMQNPEVKEIVSKLAEKSKVLKENIKELFNNATKVAKNTAEKINPDTAKIVKIQKIPTGFTKEKLDTIIVNFKNHISKLNEERWRFKGSDEEFSKKIQSLFKDFSAKYPEYGDYIKKNMNKFASKC